MNFAQKRQSDVMTTQDGICSRCGSVIRDDISDCADLFATVMSREFGDPSGYGAVHLLTVDAYLLQHDEDHSRQSSPFHLLRLCTLLEFGASPAIGAKTAKLLITTCKSLLELNPPKHRGKLTIVAVYKASSTQEHQRIARA